MKLNRPKKYKDPLRRGRWIPIVYLALIAAGVVYGLNELNMRVNDYYITKQKEKIAQEEAMGKR